MNAPVQQAWLRLVLAPLVPVFREVAALSVFVNLMALAVPVFVMQVYDRVVYHAGLATLQGLLIGVVVVLAFDWILRQCRARILQRVALRVDVVVGRMLFDKILSLRLDALEARGAASFHGLFRDVDTLRNTLSGPTALMICDVPFALCFLVLVFSIARPVALVLLALLPVFVLIAWWSGRKMIALHHKERETGIARDTLLGEIVGGRTTVKALALEGALRPLWEAQHAACIERALRRGTLVDSYGNLGATLTAAGTVLMTTVGALAIIEQQMSIGALIAANMLSGRLLGLLNQVVGNWRAYAACLQSAQRLSQVFAEEGEQASSAVRPHRPTGVLRLEDVCFAHPPGDRPVIGGVSLTLRPGSVTALIGSNGSGKSTLLKLMQGLYRPDSGRVLLDGADIGQFTRAQIAGWIGFVPQECVLFTGSIRDNIAMRNPCASDEEITRAARLAGLHDVVIDLPAGYATEVGEAGRRLSAGQRQRIAIARALLGDPPLLLFDEPTTSLDDQASRQLRELLTQLSHERTVVVVTHSLRLLSICRTLIRVEHGQVSELHATEDALPHLFQPGSRVAAE